MNRLIYLTIAFLLSLLISCDNSSTSPNGDPVVNIIVDWNSINRPSEVFSAVYDQDEYTLNLGSLVPSPQCVD